MDVFLIILKLRYTFWIVFLNFSLKVILIDALNYSDDRDILYEDYIIILLFIVRWYNILLFYERLRKQKPKQNFYGSEKKKINIFYICFTLENHNL